MSVWESSLRNYGIPKKPAPRYLKRPSGTRKSDNWPVAFVQEKLRKREERLSVVCEEDVFSEIENKGVVPRRRKSRKSTLGSVSSVISEDGSQATAALVHKAPTKVDKLISLPPTPNILSPITPLPNLVSPVPLPFGVKCIDVLDGSEFGYAGDSMIYVKQKEELYALEQNYTKWNIFNTSSSRMEKTRSILMDWLIEVVHYFKGSQESIYATIHLIDRFMSQANVDPSDVQLVGTSAVLIATKLEEYYPSDISELKRLTQGSCSEKEIRCMELRILRELNFESYSLEPMLFLNRFIRAAMRQDDKMFIEATCFFLDSIIPIVPYWSIRTSKKCAAAVYSALHLIPDRSIFSNQSLWTPTLVYYTEYQENQLVLLSRQMLELLEMTLDEESSGGVKVKYTSRSQHNAFLKSTHCEKEQLELAIDRISTII